MKRNPLIALLIASSVAVALLYVALFAFPHSRFSGAANLLLIVAAWTKLACLTAATIFAARCAQLLDGSNPARAPWLTLAVGLGFFTLGQGTLTYYQTFRHLSPFPSSADVWFVISYPLLILALVFFVGAYAKSGFLTENLALPAIVLTIGACAVAWPLLGPIARTPGSSLATALNVAYPALDLVLLIPTILLLRLTIRFRGGAVWRLWAALLTGFVFTALGDIAFAYFSTLGYTRIDPLIHTLYLIAYASLAAGTQIQYELLAPESAGLPAIATPV